MKKFLLSLACVLGLGAWANAESVTITFADKFASEEFATTWSQSGFTFTVDQNGGATAPTYNSTGSDLRTYAKNTLAISSTATIKSISFAISAQGLKRFPDVTPSVGAIAEQGVNPLVWNGEATEVTFTVGDKATYGTDGASKAGQFDISSVTIEYEGSAVAPDPDPEPDPEPADEYTTIFSETFAESLGEFTINDVVKPEAIENIWTYASYKYALATGYVSSSKTNYASESWLISPVIDLANYSEASFSFNEATNYFASVDVLADECAVMIKAGEGDWKQVTGYTMPTSLSWTWVETGDIDLKDYLNQKIQIAFKYSSTDTKAGNWEIKNLVVKGKAVTTSVSDINVENGAVEYFNLQGVRVVNPENGIYVRRQGNKVSKVVIR
jgi:hypothetical protein